LNSDNLEEKMQNFEDLTDKDKEKLRAKVGSGGTRFDNDKYAARILMPL
jgi:hypothetical protein